MLKSFNVAILSVLICCWQKGIRTGQGLLTALIRGRAGPANQILVIKWRVYSKNMPHLSICFQNKHFSYITALLALVNLTKSLNDIHSRSPVCRVHVSFGKLRCNPEVVTDVFPSRLTPTCNQPYPTRYRVLNNISVS